MSLVYYVVNRFRPDRGIDSIKMFYFQVIGTFLTFLIVFKNSQTWSRFWEARTNLGGVCNHSRSLVRRLLFSTDLVCGDAVGDECVDRLQRHLRAFFLLTMDDLRTTHDLSSGPILEVLTADELEELSELRRRPLIILAWIEETLHRLSRHVPISDRKEIELENHIEALSLHYHALTKAKSTPMPFAYSQLVALGVHVYCFTVPVAFLQDFSWFIWGPSFVMGLLLFGIIQVELELSDPFGSDHTDLKLDVFLAQVEENLGDYIHRWTRLTKAEALSA